MLKPLTRDTAHLLTMHCSAGKTCTRCYFKIYDLLIYIPSCRQVTSPHGSSSPLYKQTPQKKTPQEGLKAHNKEPEVFTWTTNYIDTSLMASVQHQAHNLSEPVRTNIPVSFTTGLMTANKHISWVYAVILKLDSSVRHLSLIHRNRLQSV